ncbi:hypothetical protein RRG08_035726 [Elysia crispata]|uniref:Uncharacterized protein n=1 Tax=Elysia crispata TaxID=231223 RepID=A0AAE0YIV7_9GAST|nr:hypothetical protein RRG08_035726 [Elysia crispata]
METEKLLITLVLSAWCNYKFAAVSLASGRDHAIMAELATGPGLTSGDGGHRYAGAMWRELVQLNRRRGIGVDDTSYLACYGGARAL